MKSTRPQEAESDQIMNGQLQQWKRLMEREAVPKRLRELASALREALTAAHGTPRP